MIGFDRPLRPHWIYETLLIARPGQETKELNVPFEQIARELTGKEGKRKVRTVLVRCFLRSEENRARVKNELVLKYISEDNTLEFMLPIYLFYLIGKTTVLDKMSKHIFRLYEFGDEINISFLRARMIEEFGERDVVIKSTRAFIRTLEYFGVVKKTGGKLVLNKRVEVSEEQLLVLLQLYSKEILNSPQIALNHLPEHLFGYFKGPDVKEVARKYNGIHWDFHHGVNADYIMMQGGK